MPKKQSIAALRDAVRSHARTQIKVAEIGGGQDAPFEQAMSNLAHAYLQDKAPTLLDYEVGFQLVDKNQENTKAIGVFGFKVGPQWLYAPVFFLNGDLKGHELLYIKNQDMFVPLKENWLNYILNRKPSVLGQSTGRNMSEIGVTPPHLYQLSKSPSKFASAKFTKLAKWLQPAMPDFAYFATTHPERDPKYKDMVSLPLFLKKEGTAMVKRLLVGMQEMPKLATVIEEFHGVGVIDEAIKEAKVRAATAASNSVLKLAEVGESLDETVTEAGKDKLKVYTADSVLQRGEGLEELNPKEREKLIKERVLIKDQRENPTVAYEVQSPLKLQNPQETGLYDVLLKPDQVAKCLVITNPYTERGTKGFATVVKIDGGEGGRSWVNIHPSHVWTTKQYTNDEYQEWWNGLSEPDSFDVSRTAKKLVIGNTYSGSCPFTVRKDHGDGKYDVWFDDWASKSRADHLPSLAGNNASPYDSWSDGTRIFLTKKVGGKLRSNNGELMVPAGYKVLELKPDRDKKDKDDDSCCTLCSDSSDPPPLIPGNMLDVENLLAVKTASLKLYDTGTEVYVNDKPFQKLAALIYLVKNVGLREKQARVLLERARTQKTARFRIKRAEQTYDLQKSGPSAPGFPEAPTGFDSMTNGLVPTQGPMEQNLRIPEMSAANTDPSVYRPMAEPNQLSVDGGPDRAAQQHAMQAAQMGQKEIFDTAMIGSLLKAVRDDSMVDKYLGDLMKGVDRLGRILFLFYWHGEKFQDRYGKGDMVELEDGLRNAFEALGDIVLFLKQRGVDANPNANFGPDLDNVSSE